jgi:hypothetical protein
MNHENWKTITDFPKYEVSDIGNVRVKESKYIMKPFKNEPGYLRIGITNDFNKRKKFYIHRLVAIEFLPNPENKLTINHKNNIRNDNRLCNLEWCTMVEQSIHKHKTNNKFEKRINIKAIWRLDVNTLEKLEKYQSTTEAVKWIKQNNLTNSINELNLRKSLINVSNGKTNSAYGYKWLYENDETNIFEDEIWKEIGINNYFVSNYGRVKNNKEEILKFKPNPHGYIKISIKNKSYSVHRLVALAFIPNIENKEFVNHKDGNKTNNNLKNLEWATCLENNIHKINNNLSNTTKKVIQYDNHMNKLNEFISIADASKKLNLSTHTITKSCNKIIKHTRKDKFIFIFG